MAVMIPEKPCQFPEGSLEDVMFEALKKLPDEYMVFHSFRITKVKNGTVHESETDFVIFHREKGILCLEAKAGAVSYRDGEWRYGNGVPMHNGGPFNQASANKWKLMGLIGNSSLGWLVGRVKFLHGVWFPSLSSGELDSISMPPEADRIMAIGREALEDPLPYIETLFSLDVRAGVVTDLSENEVNRLIREILCPEFNVFPPAGFDTDLKHMVFHRMLDEQAGILNFLTEQKTAVINGAAGTGKTLIAVEKARRHASDGSRVLFLCYNSELRKYLVSRHESSFIDFMTLDGYVCSLCKTDIPYYEKAARKLRDYVAFGNFPYEHVIVDEGQDFSRDVIEETEILQLLCDAVMETENSQSSFYVFYDRLQTVQSDRLPELIEKADCRLTLYRNCRNTENVSKIDFQTNVEEGIIKQQKKTRLVYEIKGTNEKIALKYLKKRLDLEFSIKYANRNCVMRELFSIIENISCLGEFTIFRFDFKNFFESVDARKIYDNYIEDIRITYSFCIGAQFSYIIS